MGKWLNWMEAYDQSDFSHRLCRMRSGMTNIQIERPPLAFSPSRLVQTNHAGVIQLTTIQARFPAKPASVRIRLIR